MNQYIVAAVTDLFFTTRLRAAANQVGVSLDFADSAGALVERVRRHATDLVIVDLNAASFNAVDAVKALRKSAGAPGEGGEEPATDAGLVSVVGFFSHVQTDLKERAKGAGCDRVLPRSAFVQLLPDLLQGAVDLPR